MLDERAKEGKFEVDFENKNDQEFIRDFLKIAAVDDKAARNEGGLSQTASELASMFVYEKGYDVQVIR